MGFLKKPIEGLWAASYSLDATYLNDMKQQSTEFMFFSPGKKYISIYCTMYNNL